MAVIKIKASWSDDFHLSIGDEFGYLETLPSRTLKNGKTVYFSNPVIVKDTAELETVLQQFQSGNLTAWNCDGYWDDDDVCRNGKPVRECKCC